LNPQTFPINAFEAESRRGARFTTVGLGGQSISVRCEEPNRDYPLTLDLRRGR